MAKNFISEDHIEQHVGYAPRTFLGFGVLKSLMVRGAYPTGLWPVLEILGLLEIRLYRTVFTASPGLTTATL
jgi:hypothetical protein